MQAVAFVELYIQQIIVRCEAREESECAAQLYNEGKTNMAWKMFAYSLKSDYMPHPIQKLVSWSFNWNNDEMHPSSKVCN